jgi:ASC-1-like (ASCH) protein
VQHNLKIDRTWFEAVVDGRKKAEVRRADRHFSVGDELLLYIPGTQEGALVTVTHVLNVSDVRGLECNAPIAVLSIEEPRRLNGEALSAQLSVGDYTAHAT